MAKKFYGGIDIQTNSKLSLFESSGSNFVSLRSPASLSADLDLRLPGTDTANGAMVSDGSGNLSLALIANANVSASAAIAYSKLNLSGSIVNADINASAAIAYSKLNLSGSIVNADVNASAAIAYSKLAALTASRALVSDVSGFVSVSAVTSTELGYVSGVTSAIQTQIDSKVAKSGDTMTGNLVMDNQTAVRFREATGNGTNYVGFSAPASLAADNDYTLPSAYPAANGYHLASTTAGVLSWAPAASVASYKDTWVTADTATKAITHSLGSTDVIVQIFDVATGASIEIDSVVRTDANTVTVTASEAPPAGNWRVLILQI